MKKYLFIIVIFLTILPVFSQISSSEIVVELHKPSNANKQSSRLFQGVNPWWRLTNTVAFTGIPSDIPSYSVYSLIINKNQATYEALKSGRITRIQYEKYITDKNVDTTFIDPDFKAINKLNYYVGLNKDKNIRYVIIDKNHNNDFSDDDKFVFYLKGETTKFEGEDIPIIIPTSYYDGVRAIPTTVELSVQPNSFGTILNSGPELRDVYDPATSVSINKYQYMQGRIVVGDAIVGVQAYNDHTSHVPDIVVANAQIMIIDTCRSLIPICVQIGDTILAANRKMRLSKIEKNKLYITDLGVLADSSGIDSIIPQLRSLSLADNSVVNLNELMKDKYVFLDFWGSWCNPCIQSLPHMVELYDQVKDRSDVAIIGVASEDHSDLDTLRGKILTHNVLWQNVWNRMTEVKSLYTPQGKLRIISFPSYVIVDKSGKIVFTTNDPSCKREDAISFFMDLIK